MTFKKRKELLIPPWSIHACLQEILWKRGWKEPVKESSLVTDNLTIENLLNLRDNFKNAYRHQIGKEELRRLLFSYNPKLQFTDEEYTLMFLKIDRSHMGLSTWPDFIDFLLLENKEKENLKMKEDDLVLEDPIKRPPKFIKSHHRHTIIRITFNPVITKDRVASFLNGKYVSVSKEGVINFWSLNMKKEMTLRSTNPDLKVAHTTITDLICLPDVNILCTSATERDLRFYDTTSSNFDLRMMITSIDYAIVTMYYHFFKDPMKRSILLCGDMKGNLKAFFFDCTTTGPFRFRAGVDIFRVRYPDIYKKRVLGMSVTSFKQIHVGWILQVYFSDTLRSAISCAPDPHKSLIINNLYNTSLPTIFRCRSGITCFSVVEKTRLIITGSADCVVRVWTFQGQKEPVVTFVGHQMGVIYVFTQNNGRRIYSVSRDRVIKVWDLVNKTCIQSYLQQLGELGYAPLSFFFNFEVSTLIIGCNNMAILKIGGSLDKHFSDGQTHTAAVTKALYNPLFKCLITVGMDSSIIVWNPWTGKRNLVIQHAHLEDRFGVKTNVGITVAIFDPPYLKLLTGAVDGSIKMWNFNTGLCLRNLSITPACAVTGLVWIDQRILAVGWDRFVTEWEGTVQVGGHKRWECNHSEDILAQAVCYPTALVTGSYNGELVFYRLVTGQPFKRYIVTRPSEMHIMNFVHQKQKGAKDNNSDEEPRNIVRVMKDEAAEKLLDVTMKVMGPAKVAIHAMLLLSCRPVSSKVGTLLVSLENGTIQIWTHSAVGGYIDHFYAVHIIGDYVITMTTDTKNEYLFTGHAEGYLKLWYIKYFGMPGKPPKISMPQFRLKFPFLLNDRILRRAKKKVKNQPQPLLLSSYRAHSSTITHIELIERCEIVVTCSIDKTCKFWTYPGLYIGTLGTYKLWDPINPDEKYQVKAIRIPPDIKRVISSTSLKVLTNGFTPLERVVTETEEEIKFRKKIEERERVHDLYGGDLTEPILGSAYELPSIKTRVPVNPRIDMSTSPHIRVLSHIKTYPIAKIHRAKTPPQVKRKHEFIPYIQQDQKEGKHMRKFRVPKYSSDKKRLMPFVECQRDNKSFYVPQHLVPPPRSKRMPPMPRREDFISPKPKTPVEKDKPKSPRQGKKVVTFKEVKKAKASKKPYKRKDPFFDKVAQFNEKLKEAAKKAARSSDSEKEVVPPKEEDMLDLLNVSPPKKTTKLLNVQAEGKYAPWTHRVGYVVKDKSKQVTSEGKLRQLKAKEKSGRKWKKKILQGCEQGLGKKGRGRLKRKIIKLLKTQGLEEMLNQTPDEELSSNFELVKKLMAFRLSPPECLKSGLGMDALLEEILDSVHRGTVKENVLYEAALDHLIKTREKMMDTTTLKRTYVSEFFADLVGYSQYINAESLVYEKIPKHLKPLLVWAMKEEESEVDDDMSEKSFQKAMTFIKSRPPKKLPKKKGPQRTLSPRYKTETFKKALAEGFKSSLITKEKRAHSRINRFAKIQTSKGRMRLMDQLVDNFLDDAIMDGSWKDLYFRLGLRHNVRRRRPAWRRHRIFPKSRKFRRALSHIPRKEIVKMTKVAVKKAFKGRGDGYLVSETKQEFLKDINERLFESWTMSDLETNQVPIKIKKAYGEPVFKL